MGVCVGGKRPVLQLYRNGCIKIFTINCNIGNHCLTAAMEALVPHLKRNECPNI